MHVPRYEVRPSRRQPSTAEQGLPRLYLKYLKLLWGLQRHPTLTSTSYPTPPHPTHPPPPIQVPSAAAISHFTLNIDQFWDALGPKAGPYPEIVIMGSRSGAWSALTVAAGAYIML